MNTATIEQPREDIKIRFFEVYNSPEWKSLDPIDRAQLLLVAEWVKPGAIIWGDFTHLPKILKKLWLDWILESEANIISRIGPIYRVATAEKLSQFIRNDISLKPYDKLNWEFLWYPDCCIHEYNNPRHEHESNFKFELKKEIETTGTYPEELDFCPPSFTPCGVKCTCASPLLKKWKSIIVKADPEAAQELREFHWRSEPLMKKIHQEEVKKRRREYRERVGYIIQPR